MGKKPCNSHDPEVRKGPWTMEEDLILINYIANHGEGVWNSLARSAGLKRTGKSCRLRWLNYLRPDVRRGNITPEEQFLIMELHSKWGNRWSKIAKHLPGRTDNEIKNYWRTRIQKHMKQAETYGGAGRSSSSHESINNQASPSQMNNSIDVDHHHPVLHETFPALSYNQGNVDAFPAPFPAESNNNIWSMEDLWSMQLFNGD